MNVFKEIEKTKKEILKIKENLHFRNSALITEDDEERFDIIAKEVGDLSNKLITATTANIELKDFVIEATIFPVYSLSELLIDLLLISTGNKFVLIRKEEKNYVKYALVNKLYEKEDFSNIPCDEDILYLGNEDESRVIRTVSLYTNTAEDGLELLLLNYPFNNKTYSVVEEFITQYINSKYEMAQKGIELNIEQFYDVYKQQLLSDIHEEELAKQYDVPVEFYRDYTSKKQLRGEIAKNKRISKNQRIVKKLINEIEKDINSAMIFEDIW